PRWRSRIQPDGTLVATYHTKAPEIAEATKRSCREFCGRVPAAYASEKTDKLAQTSQVNGNSTAKEKYMNWDIVEGKWKQLKGDVRSQWGKLTDDDLDVIAGKRDKLVGTIQERYGKNRDEAE